MILGLPPETWLSLTVLGAFVSALGALSGIALKDYFFARSFERWKRLQALEQVYERFRDPLLLATTELASRTCEILSVYPTVYLRRKVLASRPLKQIHNNRSDPYFQRYKLISTAYRFSAFLAWLELYRQQITFLNPGDDQRARSLNLAISQFREDLSQGGLNRAENWQQWRDTLIFREEQRAIGEALLLSRDGTRTVMGFGAFCEQLEAESPNYVQRWVPVVMNFYLDLKVDGLDFRLVRLQRMAHHLLVLIKLLDPSGPNSELRETYDKLKASGHLPE